MLLQVEPEQLLFIQSVYRQWKDFISSSSRIQKNLFFLPGGPVGEYKCGEYRVNWLALDALHADDEGPMRLVYMPIDPWADRPSPPQDSGPIELPGDFLAGFEKLCSTTVRPSWLRMDLTQPPQRELVLVDDFMQEMTKHGRETGWRMHDIVKGIAHELTVLCDI